MDDQQLWYIGIERLERLLTGLPVETGLKMTRQMSRYRQAKEALAAAVSEADAAFVCRECRGQCCLNGKYRLNVFDAMSCLVAQIPISTNFSQKPLCPYGTHAGCTMEPGLRPADCVLFICDAIDRKLSPQARSNLFAQEQVLRECIQAASGLTGEQLGTPLLLWAEKAVLNPNQQG